MIIFIWLKIQVKFVKFVSELVRLHNVRMMSQFEIFLVQKHCLYLLLGTWSHLWCPGSMIIHFATLLFTHMFASIGRVET